MQVASRRKNERIASCCCGRRCGDDHLSLNVLIFDVNDELVLRIQHNDITYQVADWEVEFKGNNLVNRDGPGEALLDIIFRRSEPRPHVTRQSALNGIKIKVSKSEMQLVNNNDVFRDSMAVQVPSGIVIGTEAPALAP